MHGERVSKPLRALPALLILLLALPLAGQAIADDGIDGHVELLYRHVNVSGSSAKYNEDLDGLSSGLRLGSLVADWHPEASEGADYARLDLSGLGGDPYERASFRLGRKGVYDLRLTSTRQDYIYDLFSATADEDGSGWNTERRSTKLDFSLNPWRNVRLFLQFHEGQRSGQSVSMKDIERKLFRLDTPVDSTADSYVVGASFRIGALDLLLKQTLRRYDNKFDAMTENDLGLGSGISELSRYAWRQHDAGDADYTTITLRAPLGSRAVLRASLYGSFLGDETMESRVALDASGTSFNGSPYAVSGGSSLSAIDGETTLVDLGLTIRLLDQLDLLLNYRGLDRNLSGTVIRDLDGDGVEDDLDGDGQPGSRIVNDQSLTASSAELSYRPWDRFGVRAGYRTIDRSLQRRGFGYPERDADYSSGGDDDTLIFGAWARPFAWLRVNADYEDGEIAQPFTAISAAERRHFKLRATIEPTDTVRVQLSWLDLTQSNGATDFRRGAYVWDSHYDGTTRSVLVWNRPTPRFEYSLRFAKQSVDNSVGALFDQAGFGAVEDGDTFFANDNKQFAARCRLTIGGPWRGWLRFSKVTADGSDTLRGDVSGVVGRELISQDLRNAEVGVEYHLGGGTTFGASYRDLDYEDLNHSLDYQGRIITLRAGRTF